jgi:hypothetical protein
LCGGGNIPHHERSEAQHSAASSRPQALGFAARIPTGRAMIDIRYIKFLLLAALACSLIALYIWLRGGSIEVGTSIISFALGAVFTSLITVRLPVFKRYYQPASHRECQQHRSYPNQQAALVMTGLVAGAASGVLLYVCGVKDIVGPIFISGVCASIVGQYHRRPS